MHPRLVQLLTEEILPCQSVILLFKSLKDTVLYAFTVCIYVRLHWPNHSDYLEGRGEERRVASL